jgi:hypothetical protein
MSSDCGFVTFTPRLKLLFSATVSEFGAPFIVRTEGSTNSSITGVLSSTEPSLVLPRAVMVQTPADPLVTVNCFAVPVETPE